MSTTLEGELKCANNQNAIDLKDREGRLLDFVSLYASAFWREFASRGVKRFARRREAANEIRKVKLLAPLYAGTGVSESSFSFSAW